MTAIPRSNKRWRHHSAVVREFAAPDRRLLPGATRTLARRRPPTTGAAPVVPPAEAGEGRGDPEQQEAVGQ